MTLNKATPAILNTTIPKKLDILGFTLFLILWIIPLGYYGFTNRPFPHMPTTLSYLHNSSALFTHAVIYWPQYFVQFQFSPDGEWITYDHNQDFRLLPFGYRSRMNRFFEIFHHPDGEKGRKELALWFRKRYAELNPAKPVPIAVRFIIAKTYLKDIKFEGHWENKPLSAFLPSDTNVISTHSYVTTQ